MRGFVSHDEPCVAVATLLASAKFATLKLAKVCLHKMQSLQYKGTLYLTPSTMDVMVLGNGKLLFHKRTIVQASVTAWIWKNINCVRVTQPREEFG